MSVVAVTGSGCATTTIIRSEPPGARAYVDDRLLGDTPLEFRDSSPFWARPRLVLRKPGYEDKAVALRKSEMRVWPLIGTVVILVPVFWLFGYPDALTYELQPEDERSGGVY